jgi:hypothetical protein
MTKFVFQYRFLWSVLSLLLAVLCHGAPTADSLTQEVMTPAQAGRLFLKNTGNFRDSSMQSSRSLYGKTLTVDFQHGEFRMQHQFHAEEDKMTWEVLTGEIAGRRGTVSYQAFDIRPGIVFIMAQPRTSESVALVIDHNRGWAAGFLGRYLIEQPEGTMNLFPIQGPILEAGNSSSQQPFPSAKDLIGSRFTVVYPNEAAVYEHIYLNDNYVTWLCHKGTSQGVADTERFHSFKVSDDLYLVAWNEKSAPIQLSFLFDFKNQQELAALFGYDESRARTVYQTTFADIPKITRSVGY